MSPSLIGSSGKRSDRYWSVRDLVTVRTIKALRQAGCPLQQVRVASQQVAELWSADLSSTTLYWDGSDVIATSQWGELVSLIKQPNQQMLQLVTLPLLAWRTDAEERAKVIDVAEIRARRQGRPGADRQRESTKSLRLAVPSSSLPGAHRHSDRQLASEQD